jgi:hypothetical protein
MRSNWFLGAGLLAMAAAGAGLQAQGTSTTTADAQSTVTVTGCLQAGGPGGTAVGTSGSTTASPSASGSAAADSKGPFMLVNARRGNAPGGGSGVTSAAPAGSGTQDSAVRAGSTPPSPALSGAVDNNGEPDNSDSQRYALRGDNPELPRHVGQEVEISGKLIPASASSGSSAGSSNDPARANAADSASVQQLDVQTIRMIASVCAAK